MHIARHSFNLSAAVAEWQEYEEALSTRLKEESLLLDQPGVDVGEGLARTYQIAQCAFRYRAIVDPASIALVKQLDIACLRVGLILRMAALDVAEGRMFEVWLGERSHEKLFLLEGSGPTRYSHARHWLECFALALVCDRFDYVERLLKLPFRVLRASATRCPEYMHRMVRAVRSLLLAEDHRIEQAKLAIQAVQLAQGEAKYDAHILQVRAAELQMLLALAQEDAQGFNAAFAAAMRTRRAVWGSPERQDNPTGWIALFALGLVTLAYLRKMPVEVSSDYVPGYLARREYR
jgi:hypothetical protein